MASMVAATLSKCRDLFVPHWHPIDFAKPPRGYR